MSARLPSADALLAEVEELSGELMAQTLRDVGDD
jgi:hypothetical protein